MPSTTRVFLELSWPRKLLGLIEEGNWRVSGCAGAQRSEQVVWWMETRRGVETRGSAERRRVFAAGFAGTGRGPWAVGRGPRAAGHGPRVAAAWQRTPIGRPIVREEQNERRVE